MVLAEEVTGQRGAVAAGPLDPERMDLAEGFGRFFELAIAAPVDADRQVP